MKKILVSECLFGGTICRYDGGQVPCMDARFLQWKEEGRLVPICPEVVGGLPVPRPDSQRVGERVLTGAGLNVTKEYTKGADAAVSLAKEQGVVCAILKEDSPSCGTHYIYDGTFSGKKIEGLGLAAEKLSEAGFPIFSENEITEVEKLL